MIRSQPDVSDSLRWDYRKVVALVLALVLAGGTYYGISHALMPKSAQGSLLYSRLYSNPDLTCDVIFVGNSHATRTFRPDVLWREYGVASRVVGGAAVPSWNAYHALAETFKTQRPKLVVIETNIFFDTEDEYPGDFIANTIPPMAPSVNKLWQVMDSVAPDLRAAWLLDISETHDSIFAMNEDGATDYAATPLYDDYKGNPLLAPYGLRASEVDEMYVPTEEKFQAFLEHASPEPKNLFWKHREFIEKMIELCNKNGAAVEFVTAPTMEGSLLERFPEIDDICNEHGVTTTDYCVNAEKLALNWEEDFYDAYHLSYSGAEKTTEATYSDVISKYDISDHRGDPAYESWERNAVVQQAQIEGFMMEAAASGAASIRGGLGDTGGDGSPNGIAAGAKGSPYRLVVDLSAAGDGLALGDFIPESILTGDDEAQAGEGVWLVGDGKATRLKNKAHPYKLVGAHTLDYRASLRYGSAVRSAENPGSAPDIPSLLIDGRKFKLEDGKAAVLVYDERLDEFVVKANVA